MSKIVTHFVSPSIPMHWDQNSLHLAKPNGARFELKRFYSRNRNKLSENADHSRRRAREKEMPAELLYSAPTSKYIVSFHVAHKAKCNRIEPGKSARRATSRLLPSRPITLPATSRAKRCDIWRCKNKVHYNSFRSSSKIQILPQDNFM